MSNETQKLAQKANDLINANRLPEAREVCEKLCKIEKDNPGVWQTLGMIDQQLGNFKDAAACFERLVQLAPEMAEAHLYLAKTLQALNELDRAAVSFRKAVEIKPELVEAWGNLGLLYGNTNKFSEAEEAFRNVLKVDSANPVACFSLGLALEKQDKNAEAKESYEEAIRLKPDYAEALNNLGVVLQKENCLAEAEGCCRKAVQVNPEFSIAYFNLGRVLFDQFQYEIAEPAFKRALELSPNNIEVLINLAHTLMSLGDFDGAIATFSQAKNVDPASIPALVGLATVLERKGDFQESLALLEPLVSRGEKNVDLANTYGTLGRRLDRRDEVLPYMLDVIADESPEPKSRGKLYNVIGMIHDDQGKYDAAFKYFKAGNDLFPQEFKREDFAREIDEKKDVFSRERLVSLPRAGNRSKRPIFIVGMPRSGTSLLEQILASHPEVYGAGELRTIGYIIRHISQIMGTSEPFPSCIKNITEDVAEKLSQQYLAHLQTLPVGDAAHVVDKMPANFLSLGLIEILFPRAHVIHITRNPMDNCMSIYMNPIDGLRQAGSNLAKLGAYYNEYLRLMDHWRNTLSMPFYEVRYEDLVSDKEKITRELIDFCGLEWNDNCLVFHKTKRHVATPSYDQVRQPIYKTSVEKWRNYQKHLQPLADALGYAM